MIFIVLQKHHTLGCFSALKYRVSILGAVLCFQSGENGRRGGDGNGKGRLLPVFLLAVLHSGFAMNWS